jgi:hypothetical protein
LDRLFALGFPFDFGVGVGFRVGFGVVARDFGLDPLLAVDEAFAASGGLEALRVLLDLRRGGFNEEGFTLPHMYTWSLRRLHGVYWEST